MRVLPHRLGACGERGTCQRQGVVAFTALKGDRGKNDLCLQRPWWPARQSFHEPQHLRRLGLRVGSQRSCGGIVLCGVGRTKARDRSQGQDLRPRRAAILAGGRVEGRLEVAAHPFGVARGLREQPAGDLDLSRTRRRG